jgi:Ankyrin repeats (3 copies)/Ankyrin repeats (many copies)
MIKLLLSSGAEVNAESTGGWTPLHNAAQSNRYGAVKILLEWPDINVNAKLYNGMTALHWAAYNGHATIVQLLISHKETNISLKDSFDRTPMLCAAEKDHSTIVYMLSPARNGERLSDVAKDACRKFESTVVDFGMDLREGRQRVFKYKVFDLLYGWVEEKGAFEEYGRRFDKPSKRFDGLEQAMSSDEQKRRLQDLVEEERQASGKLGRPTVSTSVKNVKHKPAFRWIHLPANNVNSGSFLRFLTIITNCIRSLGLRYGSLRLR